MQCSIMYKIYIWFYMVTFDLFQNHTELILWNYHYWLLALIIFIEYVFLAKCFYFQTNLFQTFLIFVSNIENNGQCLFWTVMIQTWRSSMFHQQSIRETINKLKYEKKTMWRHTTIILKCLNLPQISKLKLFTLFHKVKKQQTITKLIPQSRKVKLIINISKKFLFKSMHQLKMTLLNTLNKIVDKIANTNMEYSDSSWIQYASFRLISHSYIPVQKIY